MSELVEQTKRVRETYTIPKYIVDDLTTYAKEHNAKKSQIVAKALEEYLKAKYAKSKERVEMLHEITAILPKGTTQNKKIKEMLGNKDA